MQKAKAALDDIREALKDQEGVGELLAVQLNLSSLSSVRQCAQQLIAQEPKIHILINNAGSTASQQEFHSRFNMVQCTCVLLAGWLAGRPEAG